MTLDQFFEKLPRDGWRLSLKMLRRSRGPGSFASCCPITAAHPSQYSASEWEMAAAKLGLDSETANRIARTADGFTLSSYYDPALRTRLLAHCGLTEPQ